MEKYRILLAEDRMICRRYFETVFRCSSRYTLIGTEGTMEEAMKWCVHTPVDLILSAAADKNGKTNFAAVEVCKKEHPSVRIVLMSDIPEYTYLQRAEMCGADGFWYMEDEKQAIFSVLDRVMKGETVFPAQLPSVKIGRMDSSKLTEKELQILRELVKGDSNKEIAETLQMSYYTVRDYVKSMLEKSELPNRTALAVAAVYSGLVILESEAAGPVR